MVECRTRHESFDLKLAPPTSDQLELIAPELSGSNETISLYLTKKLIEVPAKHVNTDSALGSGTGVSVKIEKT